MKNADWIFECLWKLETQDFLPLICRSVGGIAGNIFICVIEMKALKQHDLLYIKIVKSVN
jgi:hypothetical protein